MTVSPAIFHHPDAVESPKTPLAGRRAAGQSFLGGLIRHGGAPVLRTVAGSKAHIDHFRETVGAFGWTGPIDGILTTEHQRLAEAGAMLLPGPVLGPYAWARRHAGQRLYSLIGITHTVATKRIMRGLYDLLSSPVEDWDCVICTSNAVKSVVAAELEEGARFLTRRLGARRVPMPQLPVIPLGIDAPRFAHDPAARAALRAQFSIAEDEIVVMSMGRLSVFEKMHPVPLMMALQRAAEETGATIVLLMAGWFGDERSEALHREAVSIAPDVRIAFPDGKDEDLRYGLWSAADIFALPVDNIQETFGLAPIEAMAAGLPVVCSDWDGFKDTVVHGETGFRVRTLMSRPGFGGAIARRFDDEKDSYHQYLAFVHQRTAVDIPEMAAAFASLIRDKDKRRAMGQAGRKRAERLYDWSAVIPQYQALWADLEARRARGQPTSERAEAEPANPSAMDPFLLYRAYATDILPDHALLSAPRRVERADIDRLVELTGAKAIGRMASGLETVTAVQNAVHAHGPITAAEVAVHVRAEPGALDGAVLWLAKFDLIRVAS